MVFLLSKMLYNKKNNGRLKLIKVIKAEDSS